jgi:hypothetical protein
MLHGTEWVLREVAMERERQRKEYGYDDGHDDSQVNQEMAKAACYMAWPSDRLYQYPGQEVTHPVEDLFPNEWELELHSYREGRSYRERLIIAAAFIVAEIERLDRKGM